MDTSRVNEVKTPQDTDPGLRELERALRGQRTGPVQVALARTGDGEEHEHRVAREFQDVAAVPRLRGNPISASRRGEAPSLH